ncbi:protein SpAN-like, partial [Saccoglossus kowalevskii]
MATTQELYVCLLLVASIYNINAELQPEPPEEAETPGALESDIILTEKQRTSIEQQIEEFNNGGGIRKAHADLARRWPNGVVPYVISAQSEGDRAVIEKALKYWERVSCLTFPAYSAAAGHTSRINFMKNNNYCYSSVGVANPGGSQDVSIGTGCAQIGTIAHEIGHAIGFWHEQSRTDRDNFVVIHPENIKDGKEHNFNRYTADTINSYNVPYDLGSLMHYGTHYFSKNGQPTITAVNPDDNDLIGQRNSLSPADIQLANIIYSCYTNNYVRIGCFKDVTTDRAITTLEGTDARLDGSYHTRENPLQKCADVAGDLGYKIFALQNGGWCASAASAVETFAKYGVSQDCNADGEGGPGANDVYMFTNRRVYARLGCFGDTAVRAISTLEGTDSRLDGAYASREDAIEKCSR